MRIGGGRRSRNVEDRGGQAARAGVSGGVVMLLFRLLFSTTGRRFIVPLIVVGGALYFFVPGGKNIVHSVIGMLTGQGVAPQTTPVDDEERAEMAEFASGVLATTEEVWGGSLRGYREPKMVLYTAGTQTACGFGQAAMGPFYCPPDQTIYLDLGFFKEMETKMDAGGDFAQAYVIAHEVGHHIQNQMGVLDWSMGERRRYGERSVEANRVQVRVELMADCLAGVWANKAGRLSDVELERGDLDEAIGAAEAVGDDTLQRKATGRIAPDSFTHGSSEQRIRWFSRGYQAGDADACETREIPYSSL